MDSTVKLMYTHQGTHEAEMPPKKKHSASKKPPIQDLRMVSPGVTVDGYKYHLSTRPKKKLMVRVGDQWVHFGSADYQNYHDRTGLLPKEMNHHDKARRKSYLKRSRGIKDGNGKLTAEDPKSSNYHAIRVLW